MTVFPEFVTPADVTSACQMPLESHRRGRSRKPTPPATSSATVTVELIRVLRDRAGTPDGGQMTKDEARRIAPNIGVDRRGALLVA
jgi:hypothetical protein